MSNEKKDALTLTSKMLNECKTPGEIVDLPAVEKRWVDTYNMTSGKSDGDLKFHAEKIVFLQTISESAQLAKCTPMSIYSSFILLAVSGLSLKDGQSYLIPYKNKCVWMPGWKGRLEQISQIRGVDYLAEPVCVYANEVDDFEYSIVNGEYEIKQHKPKLNTVGQDIVAVYATLKLMNGKSRIFFMKREEVLSIRDRYSQSYKDYVSVEPNEEGRRVKSGKYGEYEVEAPMWVTDEAQAFKKTLVKRIYNTLAKEGSLSASSKYVDDQLNQMVNDATMSDNTDPEEFAASVRNTSEVDFSDYEEVTDEPEEVSKVESVKEESQRPSPNPAPAQAPEAKVQPKVQVQDDEIF